MTLVGVRLRRDERDARLAVTAGVLLALAVVAVHVVGVRTFTHEMWPGAAPEGDRPVWMGFLAGVCLLVGVVAAWTCRSARPGVALGLAAAAAGAALPAWASWTGVPITLRSAVLAAPALLAAGLAQVVPRWTRGPSRLGDLAWALAAAAIAVHLVAYDAFADVHCSRVCRSAAGPWLDVAPWIVSIVVGALVLASVAVGLLGIVGGRSAPTIVRGSAGVALAALGALAVVELGWRDTEAWARTTSSWLPFVVGPPAGAVCLVAVRAARVRTAVDALLRDLDSGRAAEVHFAFPGQDRWVDASGRDVAATASGVVVLHDEHGPAVRLADQGAPDVAGELSPTRRLALANARLTALAAARLADVQAAQRRTVQRMDTERHRIERDLHDGAQQTLVSAAFHLGAAATSTGTPATIQEAQARVADALSGLRDLVHGPVPTALVDEGLEVALEDLAAETQTPITIAVSGGDQPSTEVAVATYLCVAALVAPGSARVCLVEVDLAEHEVLVIGRSASDLTDSVSVGLSDRIGAVEGTVTSRRDAREWTLEVRLPCGSSSRTT